MVIIHSPPWWTARRVLWIAAALGILVLVAATWVAVLRRRVHEQTQIIRQRLQAEAALKEHYLNLFENANEMVFTHDLSGRVTSINKAGERLLQQDRDMITSTNILDLIVPEQRPAARAWLHQIVETGEAPRADWDLMTGSGQRVKLEISSRVIEQNGTKVEVEGVARDITERRRLEREILDISNREQRRIGHDLHDGVCQQLAAIGYMSDILGDQLREKGMPEMAEAERITNLVNEANRQARSVARGLFPVRLQEHGLLLALEELAANASSRYKITCRFFPEKGPGRVDDQMELHLYYIAQEAVLNAVKHGKATAVNILLSAEGPQFKLTIQDNGTGFDPSAKGSGMGIRIMRYRATVIGATLDLQSKPNEGSTVTCVFNPSPPPQAQAAPHDQELKTG